MSNLQWLSAAMLLSFSSAFAQPSVQERKAVMDAQIELLKKEDELRQALQLSAGGASAALPQILAVMGLDGVMVARLQLANGAVNMYRVGESIRPGMVVVSISPRQVSVTVGGPKKARAVPLEFIAGAVVGPATPGFAPLPGGRPPIPAELLPEPPAVRLPGTAMPSATPSATAQGAATTLPAALKR